MKKAIVIPRRLSAILIVCRFIGYIVWSFGVVAGALIYAWCQVRDKTDWIGKEDVFP